MVKILLTNAPWYGDNWYGIRSGCRWPFIFDSPLPPENSIGGYNTFPFFMAYATNYLAQVGKVGEVLFYDALAKKHRYETFYKNVESVKPDIVILETSTPSINNDLGIAKRLKDNGAEIALAGTHATVYADELIKLPYVDYVLKGEYEVGAYEMCLMRKKGIYESKPLWNISNLYPYRELDNSIFNYADGFGQDKFIERPQLQIWTSRGCPFKCKFCLWQSTMTFGNYRVRSTKSVLRELTHCMKVYGFKSVLFDDDTFNVGDKRTIEMSEAMGNIDIQWHAMVRPDACSLQAFEKMRENGCVGLKMGIESFSQNGLDIIDKGYKADKIITTIDFLVSYGFKIFISMMDNIPGESEDDKEITKQWVDYFTSKGVSMQHPNCMPLPGTPLFKELDKENKIDKSDWLKFGTYHGEVIK